MNEQLKRIREKDYSSIDQKLFQNMTRADNLDSTLSHLSQFQKFLMEQITCMNQPSKVTAHSTIANNISKNFDNLRESLVKCSRSIVPKDRKCIVNLKKTITSLKNEVKDLNNTIQQQLKQTCEKVQLEAKTATEQLINMWLRQKTLKQEYLGRCTTLQQDKAKLLAEIQQLKQLSQAHNKKYESQQIPVANNPIESLNLNNTGQYQSKVVTQLRHETQSCYTPLRQQSINRMIPAQDRSEKTMKEVSRSDERRASISSQNSNHKLYSKCQINVAKQNELLLRKGVKQQRGKSRQKIKLVSMM